MNFTAPVVEDDALQSETLADLLHDEGLEVIECTTTAEAAELLVASTGQELKALVTDVRLAAEMTGASSRSASSRTSTSSWYRAACRPHTAGRIVHAEAVTTGRLLAAVLL